MGNDHDGSGAGATNEGVGKGRLLTAYAAFVAALWLGQTAARLYMFGLAETGTGPVAIAIHFALVLGLLGVLAVLLANIEALKWFDRLKPIAAAALVGSVHSLLTLFDIYQAIFINLTGRPAPTLIVYHNPLLALSLLDNIGISPVQVVGAVGLLVCAHILIYFPLRHALLRVATRSAHRRFGQGRIHLEGRTALAGGATITFLAVSFVPLGARSGEPLLEGLRPVFQMAPSALLATARNPQFRPIRSEVRKPPPAGSRPLILIVVDALRRDRMGVYNPSMGNTPFLSSLDAQGRLRKFDAYATCTFSFCGIMSILSSRSWNDFGARPDTLVERLAGNGYDVHLVLSGQHGTFGGLIDLLGGPIASVSDQPSRSQPDDAKAIDALRKLEIRDPRHTFLYLHFISTHAGTFIEPPFRLTPDDTGRIGTYLFNPEGKNEYRQIYDLRVRQADDVIRRAFEILDRKGLLKDALVVITSDHGQRISEGGLLYHGGEADPPTLNIPLLVYDAKGGTYPERRPASQIDVAPTFARAVGLDPTPSWKGVPLQQSLDRAAVPVGTSESTGMVMEQGGQALLYLCERRSGEESVIDLRSGKRTDAGPNLPALRSLHRRTAAPVEDAKCRK